VCITDPSVTAATRLFHYETNPTPPPPQVWVDRTVLPVTPPTACADVTGFSVFALFADTAPPTVTIAQPAATAYLLGARVAASFSCADLGTGIASCAGTVANGSFVDTASVGTKTFTVDAVDRAGNATLQTVTYTVAYGICAVGGKRAGDNEGDETKQIALRLCSADGANLSSVRIGVRPVDLDGAPLPRGTRDAFRFEARRVAYVLDLRMRGLRPGEHVLDVAVAGDATKYAFRFAVGGELDTGPEAMPRDAAD
jgi:hypothetical protein